MSWSLPHVPKIHSEHQEDFPIHYHEAKVVANLGAGGVKTRHVDAFLCPPCHPKRQTSDGYKVGIEGRFLQNQDVHLYLYDKDKHQFFELVVAGKTNLTKTTRKYNFYRKYISK